MSDRITNPPPWLGRLADGHRPALARAISAVEDDTPDAPAVLREVAGRVGNALLVGFTGPPGAGKSTLVSAYVSELRRRGLTVGVVAVDPSSGVSGGAVLGDRVRMLDHAADPGVFVRSVAARGHLGGLSLTAARVVDVMDAAGKDVVVIETVGAGQSEIEIAELADATVLVCAPGLGDSMQAVKAGIMEIAQVLAVNKADRPEARDTFRWLHMGVSAAAGDRPAPPMVRTVATTGEGVPELADAIESVARPAHAAQAADKRRRRARALVAGLAADYVRRRLAETPGLAELGEALLSGELDLDATAARALALVSREG